MMLWKVRRRLIARLDGISCGIRPPYFILYFVDYWWIQLSCPFPEILMYMSERV